jgi:hypothetical protein
MNLEGISMKSLRRGTFTQEELMEVVVPSWKQHLLQLERMTKNEKEILLKLQNLRIDPNPPEEWISLSVEKEVLNRRVRTGGLPPGYIDQ